MKVIAKYHALYDPPLLQLWIHDAPHRRMHMKVLRQYRNEVTNAVRRTSIGKRLPIDFPIDVHVLFVNPASPDNGNMYLALEQALDGQAFKDLPAVLTDDSLIQENRVSKYYPEGDR